MLRTLGRLIKPCRKYFNAAILVTLLATVLSLMSPLVIRFTVDYVLSDNIGDIPPFYSAIIAGLGGHDYLKANIWICVLAILAIALVNGLLTHLRGRFTANGAEIIAKIHKDSLYDHLQKLKYDYHVKAQTGDLIQRCTSDVDTVRRFLATQYIEFFRIVFVAVMSFGVLVNIHGGLALLSIVVMPVLFVVSGLFHKVMKKAFHAADMKEGELSTVIQENLTGVRVVRAFGRESYELEKFRVKNGEFKDLAYKHLNSLAIYWGFTDFLCISQIGIVMITGSYLAYAGSISVGTLMVFVMYVNSFVWPLRQLGRILSNLGRMEVAFGRINEILHIEPETDTPGAAPVSLQGPIEFEDVSFEYEKGQPVLQNMTFKVQKGETVAILGPTGSGKSTLMSLLLRLYDYDAGTIKINGVELQNIPKQYLRERIGIVLQEPFLYSKTIKGNIQMAKDGVSDEAIFEAARIADIHDVIMAFNDGYETMVGERGVTLSGGQKQRVAIARTLIKNSDILIFDDSLSAVDTETDARIRAALRQKSSVVTTFIISQRITTLMNADRIFVMENGRLTDTGTHQELIGREGLYRRIWDIQHLLEEDYKSDKAKSGA